MMFASLRRLAGQAAIYGLGRLVSPILALILLPLYTNYLGPGAYGRVETLVAATAVLTIVLRAGVSTAFFRFYFDTADRTGRSTLVRTSFWFTMLSASLGLLLIELTASEISNLLGGVGVTLIRAGGIGLWAQMNYEQLTALFRVEQRPLAYVAASVANVLITVCGTVGLVVFARSGAAGVVTGSFSGTLVVYAALLFYRRDQLTVELDLPLLRRMQGFGLPLVPAALALWAINFIDRLFLIHISGKAETGLYALGVRVASGVLLLMIAFQTAWPAFAYSIDDDDEARRTYAFVLTYVLYITCWAAATLGLVSPWIVRLLSSSPAFYPASRVVAPIAFSIAAYAAYVVVAIGVGRARRTQLNWIVTAAAAALNVALNAVLIPRYAMMGAAVATVIAYSAMFVGMAWQAQAVFPVRYQWRRVVTVVVVSVCLTTLGKLIHANLEVAIALAVAFPLALGLTGFYLPGERRRIRSLIPI
jgi:O-antigen/teichoic acid export membrane protein